MHATLFIYGDLQTTTGGYLYDRMLVDKLRRSGDRVSIISQPRRAYAASVVENFRAMQTPPSDVFLQDELNHPSLLVANRFLRRTPIVSIVHHLRSSEARPAWQNSFYRAVECAYLRRVDGFIFNSETTRDTVLPLLAHAIPHVVATPGGDRLGTTTEEQVRARSRASGALRLLFVGAVTPAKGVHFLVDVMAQLRAERIQLDIAGSELSAPRFARRLRAQAEADRLAIRFHGSLGDSALRELLEASDVLVLPSLYEGFGIAVLEGMSHGLPAVVTASGALPAIIKENGNGYLVEPGRVDQLVARVRGLGRDRETLLRMSLSALETAGRFPTWDQSTNAMREFLLSVARTGSRAAERTAQANRRGGPNR